MSKNERLLISIGTVTVFVNVPDECHYCLDDKDINAVEQQVVEQFLLQVKNSGLDKTALVVNGVKTEKGCLVCTIGLCLALPSAEVIVAATVGGIATTYGAFASYPSFCEGIKKAANHGEKVGFYIKNTSLEIFKRTSLYKSNLKDQEEFEQEVKKEIENWKKENKGE